MYTICYICYYLTLDGPSGGLLCALGILLVLRQREQIAWLPQLGNRAAADVWRGRVHHQLVGLQVIG